MLHDLYAVVDLLFILIQLVIYIYLYVHIHTYINKDKELLVNILIEKFLYSYQSLLNDVVFCLPVLRPVCAAEGFTVKSYILSHHGCLYH